MDGASHTVWPWARKKRNQYFFAGLRDSEGSSNTPTTCFREAHGLWTYWISAISNSAWRQALPGPPLILYCLATAVPVHVAPCPSPCNLSLPSLYSSNSTAVSIVNGYCYEWGPLLLFFFHWQAQGSQMDRLLLLLCYQDSPDTGPGLVEQSRRNDAPMGRGEGPRQRGWG